MEELTDMTIHPSRAIARIVDTRAPIFEPMIVIAIVSLSSAFAIQPYVAHALAAQGPVAQNAAQVALWLSGVLSPLAALGKALGAALVCWSAAIFLEERMPFVRLLSVFCIAETVFCARDLGMWAALFVRGLANVHSSADLLVPFGLGAIVAARSPSARIALESWDFFSLVWSVLVFWLLRTLFAKDRRTAAVLALVALIVRSLFAAAGLLYSI
jgi:hypothetical protein